MLRNSRPARPSPMSGLFLRLPGADVGTDSVQRREILREQIRVAHRDPEALLQEDHQLQKAQRVEDATLHQCSFSCQWQQGWVLDELLADEVADDRFHPSTFLRFLID